MWKKTNQRDRDIFLSKEFFLLFHRGETLNYCTDNNDNDNDDDDNDSVYMFVMPRIITHPKYNAKF